MSGAVLGALLAAIAARRSRHAEARLLAIGLVIAALIYVVLALFDDRAILAYEVIGLLLFGALAWLGVHISSLWLALGWAAHVAWDVGLHLDRSLGMVPYWYPQLCVGFDLVVAGFLLGSALRGRA